VSGVAVALAFVLSTTRPATAGLKYERNPARWQEVGPPADKKSCAYLRWSYGANYSDVEWRVFREAGEARAELGAERPRPPDPQPAFAPRAGRFRKPSATMHVDGGWLVGFSQGEFGGALYWFSEDGSRSQQVSDHQVRDFLFWIDGVYAIEGLAHLGQSRGSVIGIARTGRDGPWRARTAVELPAAPYAVSQRRDATLLITVSNGIVAVGRDRKVKRLITSPEMALLYPTSSALASREDKLYLGMRQFVGEVDLSKVRLRYLVPGKEFLNTLSPAEVEGMCRRAGF
jgi:hypothetical protein